MADLSNHASLLPPYSTAHDRRVSSVGYSTEIQATFLPLSKITLPMEAPAAELPFLAWEESVDYWRDDWPEIVKRSVIDAAEEVHLFKGTLHAVETALSTLGIHASITEWWETEPLGQRGTFAVIAYPNAAIYGEGAILDARLQEDAIMWVSRSKPLTRHFSFMLGAAFEQSVGVASASLHIASNRRAGQAQFPQPGLSIGCALSGRSVATVRSSGRSELPATGSALHAAFAGRAVAVLKISGDLAT